MIGNLFPWHLKSIQQKRSATKNLTLIFLLRGIGSERLYNPCTFNLSIPRVWMMVFPSISTKTSNATLDCYSGSGTEFRILEFIKRLDL